MLIIGHRWQEHQQRLVEMIEIDIRKREDELVLSHDRPGSEQLLSLNEIILTAKVPLNLELKESGLAAEVLAAIKNFSSKVLISSKYPGILKQVRALDENIQLGLVLGRANFFLLPMLARLDRELKLYSVHPKTFLAKAILIRWLHHLGKKVFVWTVNDPKEFAKLHALQVDGVFTDYPNLIKNHD